MGIEMYSFPPSVPCRMVRLLAEHLELELDIKNVDILKGEQMDVEYIKINPQHTIPTIVDDGFIATESRAILMYLANKYSKDESLYPAEPDKRALVDMRMLFDSSTLYIRLMDAYFPVIFTKAPLDPAKVEKVDEALGYVENFLADGFIAGSELTIADFSMVTILSTLQAIGQDLSKFSAITEYLEKCSGLMKGYEDINQAGSDMFGELFKAASADA